MNRALDLEAVADAVIAAHAVIEKNGTVMMKTLSMILLLNVGKKIACRIVNSEEVEISGQEAMDILRNLLEKGT